MLRSRDLEGIRQWNDPLYDLGLIWAWDLATEWFTGLCPNKAEAFCFKINNYIDKWGEFYSEKILSW